MTDDGQADTPRADDRAEFTDADLLRADARGGDEQVKIFQSVEPDGNGRFNSRLDQAVTAAAAAESKALAGKSPSESP